MTVDFELVEHFSHELVGFDVVARAVRRDTGVVVECDDVVTVITEQRLAFLALHWVAYYVHAERTFHFGDYAFVACFVLNLRFVYAEDGL